VKKGLERGSSAGTASSCSALMSTAETCFIDISRRLPSDGWETRVTSPHLVRRDENKNPNYRSQCACLRSHSASSTEQTITSPVVVPTRDHKTFNDLLRGA
jgi:hypothetical protein